MNTQAVCCREILRSDIDGVLALLCRGFPAAAAGGWDFARLLRRLSERPALPGCPQFGHLLEAQGAIAGVLLVVSGLVWADARWRPRCGVSSWYVVPEYRAYAPLLAARPLAIPGATIVNWTPDSHTLRLLRVQGFEPLFAGRTVAFPALGRLRGGAVVTDFKPVEAPLDAGETRLMIDHVSFGCLGLICADAEGLHPFIFQLQSHPGRIRHAQLIYCRHISDFVRCSRALGLHLARRGIAAVVIASNFRVPGLTGMYVRDPPIYCRGPHPPCLGDLAYSERAFFGAPARFSLLRDLCRSGFAAARGLPV
jgi:hypothetical protein